MEWSDEAKEILAELLRYLPGNARDAVEEKTGVRAEALTTELGEDEGPPARGVELSRARYR
ncbi:MAG: hypothetical protein ABSD88_17885 [Candidatus Korobacteraceae bacterium]|jgi:hypothetical protein